MRYLLLIYGTDESWDTVTDEERQAMYQEYYALSDDMRARGVFVESDELTPRTEAKTVRVREGNALVTDGPYVETKERVGGYYLIDCGSAEEAIEWAARIPSARRFGVEVRPVVQHDRAPVDLASTRSS